MAGISVEVSKHRPSLVPERPLMTHLLTVSGSPSATSRGNALAHLVGAQLAAEGHQVDHLSVRDLPAEALLHADFGNAEIRASQEAVDRADGLVIVTPVYKASFSGALKAWLDLLPQTALEGKTVLPLATSGSLAHALALDYALRPVLQALGARHVVQSHLVTDTQLTVGPDGSVRLHESAVHRLDATLDAFVDALPYARTTV